MAYGNITEVYGNIKEVYRNMNGYGNIKIYGNITGYRSIKVYVNNKTCLRKHKGGLRKLKGG